MLVEKPSILIVCEGRNTEPSYFKQFRLTSATIKAVGEGYNTVTLVNRANHFVDSGGCPNENYKTLLEKTVPFIANKNQKGFSVQNFCKYSDKVDQEAKDNVKRFLMRMIRNIDSYE